MAELHLTRRFGAARPAAIHSLLCAAIAFGMLAYYKPLPHVDLYPTYVAARLANEGRWGHIYHASIWLHGSVDPEWDARANELMHAVTVGTERFRSRRVPLGIVEPRRRGRVGLQQAKLDPAFARVGVPAQHAAARGREQQTGGFARAQDLRESRRLR